MELPTTFIIVTGGNTGLGFECASTLSKDSCVHVVIACRDIQKGEQAARHVRETKGNATALPLDLSSQALIRKFVEEFRKSQFPPLAGIVCNAGMQNVGAPTRTEEGMRQHSPSITWGTIC
jgi:NAD(P)-dependent dehydrogenase (short-subunit alcohol dehydrogenase family)